MSNIKKLFEMVPDIRNAVEGVDKTEINGKVMKVFKDKLESDETVLEEALNAYSKQGFFASPQVNSKHEKHRRFFDWSIVNLVRRTGICPTSHQIAMLDTYVFVIQYLITGGFKNSNVDKTNESILQEFDEANAFVKTVIGVNLNP